MTKFTLLSAVLLVAVGVSEAVHECYVEDGKKLYTFGGTREFIRFPCKYNAVRKTVCGDYTLTVTPGNMLENIRKKLYVLKTMWVSVTRRSDGLKWGGRTDLKIASKYLEGLIDAPFNTKIDDLAIKEVVDFGPRSEGGEVSMTAKNGHFKISFGLFNPDDNWHKDSTFSFQCFNSTFEPTDYPEQLCGNGTYHEVKAYKKSEGWKDNRQATLFYNVFSTMAITQTETECILTQEAMANNCVYNGHDRGYNASVLCWPVLGDTDIQRCLSKYMDSPISVFRHCVEFVCSNFTNEQACEALANELDFCPNLPGVSDEVKSVCRSDLHEPLNSAVYP